MPSHFGHCSCSASLWYSFLMASGRRSVVKQPAAWKRRAPVQCKLVSAARCTAMTRSVCKSNRHAAIRCSVGTQPARPIALMPWCMLPHAACTHAGISRDQQRRGTANVTHGRHTQKRYSGMNVLYHSNYTIAFADLLRLLRALRGLSICHCAQCLSTTVCGSTEQGGSEALSSTGRFSGDSSAGRGALRQCCSHVAACMQIRQQTS
jgi:hypothetical protein